MHEVMTYSSVLFPAPALRSTLLMQSTRWGPKYIRLPWIHKRDPLAFHSVNALVSKNHAAEPLSRAFRTKLWFVDGSGGESQCWTSHCSWSPTRYRHAQQRGVETRTNVSSYSFCLTLGEERLRTQVSRGDICFACDTYPNLVEYYLLMPCHLKEQILRNVSANNHASIPHLP